MAYDSTATIMYVFFTATIAVYDFKKLLLFLFFNCCFYNNLQYEM